ncbi:MAG: shikimate kinase [Actinobacteria bacterium]|nr:shikimate kinase [Actinomycetota bacterium]
MMGSGKTTVGRRLAKTLDVDFVDTDAELEASTGRSVTDWFSGSGEEAFRAAESSVIARVLGADTTQVVATGGGAVLAKATRALLVEHRHTVVWLRAGPAFLASRLVGKRGGATRPLLGGKPRAALERLDAERRDLYAEVADIIVDIEPVMSSGDHPRRRLSNVIAETLVATGRAVYR